MSLVRIKGPWFSSGGFASAQLPPRLPCRLNRAISVVAVQKKRRNQASTMGNKTGLAEFAVPGTPQNTLPCPGSLLSACARGAKRGAVGQQEGSTRDRLVEKGYPPPGTNEAVPQSKRKAGLPPPGGLTLAVVPQPRLSSTSSIGRLTRCWVYAGNIGC